MPIIRSVLAPHSVWESTISVLTVALTSGNKGSVKGVNHHYRSGIKLASLGFGMEGSRRLQRPP